MPAFTLSESNGSIYVMQTMIVRAGAGAYIHWTTTASGASVQNQSGTVPASGFIFRIYYR